MAVKGRLTRGQRLEEKQENAPPPPNSRRPGRGAAVPGSQSREDSDHGPGFTGAIGKLESEVSVRQERE